jgi:hypothetical protein
MFALFAVLYVCSLLFFLFITIGYILENPTIKPADKPGLIQVCVMLYFSTLFVLVCQFTNLIWYRVNG